MDAIRKEIRDLITINERIQSALAQGAQMTEDESALIQMCASELLAGSQPSDAVDQKSRTSGTQDPDGNGTYFVPEHHSAAEKI